MTNRPSSTSEIGAIRILRRGASRRCPVCGEWKIFKGWFALQPSCPQCGFVFERREGQFIGGIGVNTMVSFTAIVATMGLCFLLTAPEFSLPWILGPTLAVGIIMPAAFFPVSKTLWAAIDLIMIPLEPDEAPLRQRPLPKRSE